MDMDVDVRELPNLFGMAPPAGHPASLAVEVHRPSSAANVARAAHAPVILTLQRERVRTQMLLETAPPCVAATRDLPATRYRLRPPTQHVETPLAKAQRRAAPAPQAKQPIASWFATHATPSGPYVAFRPSRLVVPRKNADPDNEDDSPKEGERTFEYQQRRSVLAEQARSMLPFCVTHQLHGVDVHELPCKQPGEVIAQLHTVGYRYLKGTFHWSVRKPFTYAEAYHAGLTVHRPLQELSENSGEWNMVPTLCVDCTPLHRHLNDDDIHSGEHSTVICRMVQDPTLSPLLAGSKKASPASFATLTLTTSYRLCVSIRTANADQWLPPA